MNYRGVSPPHARKMGEGGGGGAYGGYGIHALSSLTSFALFFILSSTYLVRVRDEGWVKRSWYSMHMTRSREVLDWVGMDEVRDTTRTENGRDEV